MSLDEMMNEFRLAGRELFNQYFRVSNPYPLQNVAGYCWNDSGKLSRFYSKSSSLSLRVSIRLLMVKVTQAS